jgi:hypothetical protein
MTSKVPIYLKFGPPNPEAQTGSTPDTGISVQELKGHNGQDSDKPIYMAVKCENDLKGLLN